MCDQQDSRHMVGAIGYAYDFTASLQFWLSVKFIYRYFFKYLISSTEDTSILSSATIVSNTRHILFCSLSSNLLFHNVFVLSVTLPFSIAQ